MRRDELVTPLVVKLALGPAMNAGDGQSVGLVEVTVRLVMLQLPVFDDEMVLGPKAIDRQPYLATRLARVTEKPVEPVLTRSRQTQHLVAKVQHVRLVTVASSHAKSVVESLAQHTQRL